LVSTIGFDCEQLATVKQRDDIDFKKELRVNMSLLAIENQLQHEPLALSCRVFSVTYGFLASVSI